MDIAQREGTLVQIDPYVCSYKYVHKNMGLIIENINYEKKIGSRQISRQIH